jgi:flagellar assembly protein FliH
MKGGEPTPLPAHSWHEAPGVHSWQSETGPRTENTGTEPESQKPLPDFEQKLAAAHAEMERRVHEAHDAALRQGEAAGRKAAMAQVQPVLDKLSASILQLAEFRPRLRAEAEADMVRLAIAIARRVVNRELSIDREAITGIIRVGLDKLRVQETARARVHPEHQPAVREYLARSGIERVEVVGDSALDRGSIVFETTRGDLDLSVETQLREIERGLADHLEKGR